MSETETVPGRVERARTAVAAVFLVNGLVVASWVPHIPAVKQRLEIGEATLGLLLLCMAAGALVAFPVTSRLVGRHGSRGVTIAAATLLALALPLPILSLSPASLAASLLVFGAANGSLDVAMNAQAVLIERRLGRPILSSLHALYSAGGLVGAGAAAAFLWAGVEELSHACATMVVCTVFIARASPHLLSPETPETRDGPMFAAPDRALLAIGALAFLGLMAEGSMADWSALYFRETLRTDSWLAGTAFAAFSLAMAAGRWFGDRLVSRFGSPALLTSSAWLAAGGLAIALAFHDPAIALAGCVAVGFGIANVVPVLFRTAATAAGDHPERGLAAVTTTGYLGFLAGPPAIGLVAGATSLSLGLGVVAVACAVIGAAGARAIATGSCDAARATPVEAA